MLEEVSTAPQSNFFKREATPRGNQCPKYEKRFNGYCFSCSNFGHKAMDCRINGGRHNDKIRCWTCDRIRHVAANCHTLN